MVYTNASKSWGCVAFCDLHWFQLELLPRLFSLSIAVKEMFPAVLATACFGHHDQEVIEFVDNEAMVEVLKATYSKDLHLMYFIRVLVFFASKYDDFWFTASHIPGRLNRVTDELFRNNMSVLFQQVPQADPQPILPPKQAITVQNQTYINTVKLHMYNLYSKQIQQ